MFTDLVISSAMVVSTVIFHALSLYTLMRVLRFEEVEERHKNLHPASPRVLGFTVALVLGLFAIHGVEIWAYGLLFYFSGAVEGLEPAVYFSTITYSTIGYDDHMITDNWRLVAAVEGVNGVILLGWSTAFFVTTVIRRTRSPS